MSHFFQDNPFFANIFFTILPWGFILVWFVYSTLVLLSRDIREFLSNYYFVQSIPSVFITLGLFGTFMGITYGLLNFDTSPDAIKSSVKELLDGLKVAFFTSIAGIFLSILFSKIIKYKMGSGALSEPHSPELDALNSINSSLRSIRTLFSSELKELNGKIGSLENNQYDAMVNGLKDVLKNFNNVFTEFIGKLVQGNFDELTSAIQQLLLWQEEYRVEIIGIKESYESLVRNHKEFVGKAEAWVHLMNEIAGQSSRLQDIVNEFHKAFDENGQLSHILSDVNEASGKLNQTAVQILEASKEIRKASSELVTTEQKVKEWTEVTKGVADKTSEIAGYFGQVQKVALVDLREEFNKDLFRTFSTLDLLMKEYVKKLQEGLVNNRKEQ